MKTHGTNHNAVSRPEVTRRAFDSLDDLPPDLRREVCFSSRLWDATDIRDQYQKNVYRYGRQGCVDWLIQSIHYGDEYDLAQFAVMYLHRYKTPLPHVGAAATIIRFRPVVRSGKAINRRQVVPLRCRDAWREAQALMPRDYEPPAFDINQTISREVDGRFSGLDIQ